MAQGKKNPLWFGFTARLNTLLRMLGLSRRQIELRAGCALHLSYHSSGVGCPRIATVERIAAELGVSPVWLAFGDEGTLVFEQKRARSPVPLEPPLPTIGGTPFKGAYAGVGTRLSQRREELQIGLRRLGELAGVSGQAIIHCERGRQVGIDTAERLAMALHVAPGWLAYADGEVAEVEIEPKQRARAHQRHMVLTELLHLNVVNDTVLHAIAQRLVQGREAAEPFMRIREWTVSYHDRSLSVVVDIPAGRRPEPILQAIQEWLQGEEDRVMLEGHPAH